jgi:hypothetical protein
MLRVEMALIKIVSNNYLSLMIPWQLKSLVRSLTFGCWRKDECMKMAVKEFFVGVMCGVRWSQPRFY